VLPFWKKNTIVIRSWLRKSSGCESRRRVTVMWPTKAVTTSNKLLREEGSTGREDGTFSKKEEDDTSKESSSKEAGASDKRAPWWL
jgi:hypothetical protein